MYLEQNIDIIKLCTSYFYFTLHMEIFYLLLHHILSDQIQIISTTNKWLESGQS